MSNRPKIMPPKKLHNPTVITKVKTPARIRIFSHVGDMAGCGTIRIIIPNMILNNYYSKDYQFEAIYNNRYTACPGAYSNCSYVIFQRSATADQHKMIKHLKQTDPGRKIIYEIDDDLLNIPEWNFASSFYNEKRNHIEAIMRDCDGIVCSTEELKRLLTPYNKKINVSPNHLPKFIWGDIINRDVENNKTTILYAGSHNHFSQDDDRGDFSPELIRYVKDTIDLYKWIFVGGIPTSLKGDDRIITHFWKPTIEYPRFLKSLNADIFLAPLDKNSFNSSKSNIKALEAIALGIPLVSTKFGPYKDLPYSASTTEYFIGLIESLASNPEVRRQVWQQQYDVLKGQLWWEANEHKNLLDYVNAHLTLCGKML